MTDIMCRYQGDRDLAIVSYMYDDGDPVERRIFEDHLSTCARCRREVNALGGVRVELSKWVPPEPGSSLGTSPTLTAAAMASPRGGLSPVSGARAWWRQPPRWAQVAAATLFLGLGAGLANLNIHYDKEGLTVRTGWSTPAAPPPAPSAADLRPVEAAPSAPWREELIALETRLRADLSAQATAAAAPAPARTTNDAELLKRVRALVDESERRQQRELALRVADVLRDVDTQRRADLLKIDRSLGAIQNNTGVEVMKQQQLLNYLVRVSQKQ